MGDTPMTMETHCFNTFQLRSDVRSWVSLDSHRLGEEELRTKTSFGKVYPLAIENDHSWVIYQVKMVISHGYIGLPEGIPNNATCTSEVKGHQKLPVKYGI